MSTNTHPDRDSLLAEHEPEAVARRLALAGKPQVLPDAVLGGIDGCITTFAIVTGSVGAGFAPHVSVILGIANLLADGLSMAVSNYESIKAQNEFVEATRRAEERHIELVPEGEREEIRQIFAQRGYTGERLERIVRVITSDRKLWVDTMLAEEHGLGAAHPDPKRAAAATMIAFVVVGFIPLAPLLIPALGEQTRIYASVTLAGAMFFAIGSAKSLFLGTRPLRSGLKTLLTGGTAAALAFAVGYALRNAFGV